MMKNVVIVDANNVISNGGLDVLKRHMEYAKELQKLSRCDARLVIVGNDALLNNFSQISDNSDDSLLVISIGSRKFSKVLFWKYALACLKKERIPLSIAVAGDPWVSGVNATLIKLLRRKDKVLLQIQLHADIFAKGWKFLNFANFIKFCLARVTLLNADLIRTVSRNQSSLLIKQLHCEEKVSCIPVALNRMETPKSEFNDSLTSFGFFGRLHKDRGTELLVAIFKNLLKEYPELGLIIGGTGPEFNMLERELANTFPAQVKLLGNLSPNDAFVFWNQIDVLLSLARFESYGRAPREAILNRVPVLALSSSGILDLKESQLGKWVEIIPSSITARELVKIAREILEESKKFTNPEPNMLQFDSAYLVAEDWCKALKLELAKND
jgi:glycosyltransferase involved in cell wall biosynthesis